MPTNHNGRALERLLRQSTALEVQGNRELRRLNQRDRQLAQAELLISEAQGRELFLEGSLFDVTHGPGPGGTWNALDEALQPDYEAFDYLRWSLWQNATEYWPIPVEVLADIKIKVKSQEAKGKHGARHVIYGKKPIEVEIKCKLWTTIHFAAYTKISSLYGKGLPISKTGNAVTIIHPNTARCGIKHFVITEVGSPRHKGNQMWEAEIKAKEFTPKAQRDRAGQSQAAVDIPRGQDGIDRAGETNRAPQANQSIASPNRSTQPPEPLMSSQSQPDAGIPASAPPGS